MANVTYKLTRGEMRDLRVACRHFNLSLDAIAARPRVALEVIRDHAAAVEVTE